MVQARIDPRILHTPHRRRRRRWPLAADRRRARCDRRKCRTPRGRPGLHKMQEVRGACYDELFVCGGPELLYRNVVGHREGREHTKPWENAVGAKLRRKRTARAVQRQESLDSALDFLREKGVESLPTADLKGAMEEEGRTQTSRNIRLGDLEGQTVSAAALGNGYVVSFAAGRHQADLCFAWQSSLLKSEGRAGEEGGERRVVAVPLELPAQQIVSRSIVLEGSVLPSKVRVASRSRARVRSFEVTAPPSPFAGGEPAPRGGSLLTVRCSSSMDADEDVTHLSVVPGPHGPSSHNLLVATRSCSVMEWTAGCTGPRPFWSLSEDSFYASRILPPPSEIGQSPYGAHELQTMPPCAEWGWHPQIAWAATAQALWVVDARLPSAAQQRPAWLPPSPRIRFFNPGRLPEKLDARAAYSATSIAAILPLAGSDRRGSSSQTCAVALKAFDCFGHHLVMVDARNLSGLLPAAAAENCDHQNEIEDARSRADVCIVETPPYHDELAVASQKAASLVARMPEPITNLSFCAAGLRTRHEECAEEQACCATQLLIGTGAWSPHIYGFRVQPEVASDSARSFPDLDGIFRDDLCAAGVGGDGYRDSVHFRASSSALAVFAPMQAPHLARDQVFAAKRLPPRMNRGAVALPILLASRAPMLDGSGHGRGNGASQLSALKEGQGAPFVGGSVRGNGLVQNAPASASVSHTPAIQVLHVTGLGDLYGCVLRSPQDPANSEGGNGAYAERGQSKDCAPTSAGDGARRNGDAPPSRQVGGSASLVPHRALHLSCRQLRGAAAASQKHHAQWGRVPARPDPTASSSSEGGEEASGAAAALLLRRFLSSVSEELLEYLAVPRSLAEVTAWVQRAQVADGRVPQVAVRRLPLIEAFARFQCLAPASLLRRDEVAAFRLSAASCAQGPRKRTSREGLVFVRVQTAPGTTGSPAIGLQPVPWSAVGLSDRPASQRGAQLAHARAEDGNRDGSPFETLALRDAHEVVLHHRHVGEGTAVPDRPSMVPRQLRYNGGNALVAAATDGREPRDLGEGGLSMNRAAERDLEAGTIRSLWSAFDTDDGHLVPLKEPVETARHPTPASRRKRRRSGAPMLPSVIEPPALVSLRHANVELEQRGQGAANGDTSLPSEASGLRTRQ